MNRTVLDTNVFVSAFLLIGRLNRLSPLLYNKRYAWLLSQEIFEEYTRIASRPLYRLDSREIKTILYQVKERAEWVQVHSRFQVIPEDPTDDKFLACAVDGRADWIVTGDRHLLRLGSFQRIRIVTPADFLKSFQT